MKENIYKIRQEGINKLTELTSAERKNPKKLLDIENKYQLGYNIIVEFCDKSLVEKIRVLYHYSKLNMSVILNILIEKKEFNNKDLTPEQILRAYCGISKKLASSMVEIQNEIDQQESETFAKEIAAGLRNGIKKAYGLTAWYDFELNMSQQELFTLGLYQGIQHSRDEETLLN